MNAVALELVSDRQVPAELPNKRMRLTGPANTVAPQLIRVFDGCHSSR